MNQKIIITGGHLTPALAIIEELKKQENIEIYYLGRKYSFEGKKILSEEARIVPSLGVNFIPIISGRLQRKFTLYTLPSLLKIPFSFFQTISIINKIKPNLILSFGSYVSVPVVIVGWIKRVPVITHEQTTSPGLANKINAYFSKLIAISFKNTVKDFPQKKTVFTGNPLRKEIFEIKKTPFSKKIDLIKKMLHLPLIYVTGGGQGSSVINGVTMKSSFDLLESAIIIHQTGELEYRKVLKFWESLPKDLKERYFIKNYISKEEIGWVLNKADLVISRSGANIVWELGILRKPAILIPLTIAGAGEQMKNALLLKRVGLAEIIPQKHLSKEKLLLFVKRMISNPKKYQKKIHEAKNEFIPDGAKNLVRLIHELLEKKEKQN